LIDKEGAIYQTASLHKVANHVGKMQSRCMETLACSPVYLQAAKKAYKTGATALTRHEIRKSFPNRYPSNFDSIGIELVGDAIGPEGKEIFESVADAQNLSLRWLTLELAHTFKVEMQAIYRHPVIGRKNATEASNAKWN
jgi:N-acetyl-anhydromuramyl-L-alanine amidase AmpD